MSQYIKNVGDTAVVLELWVYDTAGVGVQGLTPKLSIRRSSDNMYLDFADNVFKSSGWTTRQVTMTEVSTTLCPGCYRYLWNSSLSVTESGDYAAEYDSEVVGYGRATDYISFLLEDVSDVRKFMYNKRKIDKTTPHLEEVLYEDDGTTEKKRWSLTHSSTEDSRTPV